MPIIRVEMFEGRSEDSKAALVEALTESFVSTCGGSPESVHIVINDISKQNWGVAGTLISRKAK
ncbi:MAG: 2-hydroxymuconate tautomerase [Alphaproteobacteria bacterium]|nr:2-hydroxymuconate tautomerase [Alphaproteobacteria bacterium]